jgi:hypothetical protein
MFAHKTALGTWSLVLGCLTSIRKLDGVTTVLIPHEDGTTFASSVRPWHMKQYKDALYLARQGVTRLLRSDGEVVMNAGIAAPSTAAVLADDIGAGSLPAGDYIGVVTFMNSLTSAESDYSPVSDTLTLGADRKIGWTAIPVSTNGQVNARRLYRTLMGQTAEYYFVAQISNNWSTTYTDDVEEDDLGATASEDNAEPPTDPRAIEVWRERLWITNGKDLWFSRPGLPESVPDDNLMTVFADDGHKLRGMQAYGDRLIIGKTNKVHYVVGSGRSDFELHTLSDTHGCASGHSFAVAEGILFWYSGDDFYESDGSTVRSVTKATREGSKIKDILASITDDEKENVVAWVHPELSWYCATVPTGGDNKMDLTLVYDYKARTWTTFKYANPDDSPAFCGEFFDNDLGRILYCAFYDGHVYQWQNGQTDDGTNYTCTFRGKSFGYDSHAVLKAMRRLHVQVPTIAEDLIVNLYRDQDAAAISTRTVSLNVGREWKRTNVTNIRDLGAVVSVEFSYAGDQDFEIDGIAFEIVKTGRSRRPA